MERIKQCIKRFFSVAFDLSVRRVVNISTVLSLVLAVIIVATGWAPVMAVKSVANVLFCLMAVSMAGYFLHDLAINLQIAAFIGRTAARVDATRAEMESPSKYKAFFMAEALAKDIGTIKYLDKINIVSAYDTLVFAARNFGYVLLPVLVSFGLDLQSLGVTWWPLANLWRVSLIVFMARYLGILAVTLAATGLAGKYNEVLDFYEGDLEKKGES